MVIATAKTVDEWQDVASRGFVPLECSTTPAAFTGSLESIQLGPRVSVSAVDTTGTVITRTPSLAAKAANDDLHLSVQLRSTGVICQGNTRIAVAPGCVAVYATHEPYELDYSAQHQRQVVVQMPRSDFDMSAAALAHATQLISVADSAARRVFSSFVVALIATHDTLNEGERDDYARVTTELAATMLRTSDDGARNPTTSPQSMLIAIQTFIQENFRSTELTLDLVARAHFISRRKLYDLFAPLHTTPSAFIRGERLDLASRLLVDPSISATISEIALRCGFSDVTTFTRAFRLRFGMRPREWRADTAGRQGSRG